MDLDLNWVGSEKELVDMEDAVDFNDGTVEGGGDGGGGVLFHSHMLDTIWEE